MKQISFLFGLSLLLFSSCKSKTCINGTVVNSKTGEPIEGVRLEIRYDYLDHGSRLSGVEIKSSDANGHFSFSDKEIFSVGIGEIRKSGFAYRYGVPIEDGEENNIEIKLTPLDEVLKLKIINSTGTYDSICVGIRNKCEYVYYHNSGTHSLKAYPLKIDKGESYEELLPVCKGEYTYIRWDFQYLQFSLPPRDSILISSNDTTIYTIEY